MLHLHTERLAALGDDIPTNDEAAHLAACPTCAHERAVYQALVAMAHAEREPFGLPVTRWDSIAAELALTNVATPAPARRRTMGMLRIAAGLLLVAGGVAVGRVSAGAGPLPTAGSIPTPGNVVSVESPTADSVFASVEDARAAQARFELRYQQAAAYLAQHDTAGAGTGNPVAYRSRLAALDRVISTTSEALRTAPHDPVINGYYLTTLGQREATLRQLNTALPATHRVNSF